MKTRNYWAIKKNIIIETAQIIATYNGWPNSHLLRKNHSDFLHGVQRHYGSLTKLREELNLPSPDAFLPRFILRQIQEWSEPLAYWLGLIATDGWVSIQNNSVRVELQEKDREVLDYLHSWFGLKNKLSSRVRDNKKSIGMNIAGNEIINFVTAIGMPLKNKSHTLAELYIPETVFMHFLRGAIDGDGSVTCPVYKSGNKHLLRIDLYGTRNFLEFINRKVNAAIELKHQDRKLYQLKFPLYTLCWQGFDARQVRNYIYKDATLCMHRKKIKAYEATH